jgi:hypothetical protein
LAAVNSGKCLNVTGGKGFDGALIEQLTCTGGDTEKWTLVPVQ